MLSIMLFHGDSGSADSAVLLFLHGIGEAFHNSKTNSVGFKNLFQQGIPQLLFDPVSVLGAEHPLLRRFIVLAPQLPDRDSVWNQVDNVEQIRGAINFVSGRWQRPIYIIGFSKGGRAAFQLAKPIGCKAIVTIDASPVTDDPAVVTREISECSVPTWMIFTSHPPDHPLHRIPKMHDATALDNHVLKQLDKAVPPQAGARCKSLVLLDNVPTGERHGALCKAVTTSQAPYNWLLMH